MFNFDFPRKTRSKLSSHPLFSALRYFTRPLYAQRKIYHAFPVRPTPTISTNRPRKRLVFDRSLRQLRTERTLRGRPHKEQIRVPKPAKTEAVTFEELCQQTDKVVADARASRKEFSPEEKIFFRQLGIMRDENQFKKFLQANRELATRGKRDAPKLEKARRARANMAARNRKVSSTTRREKKCSENLFAHKPQFQKGLRQESKNPKGGAYQEALSDKANAARKRHIMDLPGGQARHKNVQTQAHQNAYFKRAASLKREAERNKEQEQKEALEQQKAQAEALAREDAIRREREAMARAAEQARINDLRRQQQAKIQAELQRQRHAWLQYQERLKREAAIREAHLAQEALRQEQARREQAAREQQAREQAQREQAVREKAALNEAHKAAMYQREEALRQAASGIGALSAAAIRQEEEAFRQRKEHIQQVLLAAFAEATQRGVQLTPYEPEPLNAIALYELKWEELRANKAQLQPRQLTLVQLPWPVFEYVSDPNIITYGTVHAFVFNELRPGAKNKTKRDRLRPEILRYHPDKFNSNILPLVHPDDVEAVMEAADRVAKILNHLMELPM